MKFKIGDRVKAVKGKECSACEGRSLLIHDINSDVTSTYPITTITATGNTEFFREDALENDTIFERTYAEINL